MADHNSGQEPWEGEYARRGHLWGGAVRALPQVPPGGCVLELGCGNGKTSRALLERGYDLVGIDLSASALRLCCSSVPNGTSGQFALADACHLPFADAAFEAVIAFHVIGHLPAEDRVHAAQEASRVLRTGGILSFSGFSTGDFRSGTGRRTEPGTVVRRNGIATHYFTEDEVLALFGGLHPLGCTTQRWNLTVRGERFSRAEITAAFTKLS